jgi:hypothetical protein
MDPVGVNLLGELFAEQVGVQVQHPSLGVEIVREDHASHAGGRALSCHGGAL